MRTFWLCFLPLFVAVDPVGILPAFLALTGNLDARQLKRAVVQSVWTALSVVTVFLLAGPRLLLFLGVSPSDFMIAGGLLLLALSLSDLLTYGITWPHGDPEVLGAVPIGIPLIAGPATLTTCVLLSKLHGPLITWIAATVNVLLAGAAFWFVRPITRFLGRAGSRTISKLASLVLAAIAVMLIRVGIQETLRVHFALSSE